MTDVLVIGGGLAGWRAAEAASKAGCSVTLVANGDGNSPQIHALNCPVRPDDSAERMFADTMASGHGTNDPALVRVLCEEAVKLKDEFPFDRASDGAYLAIQPLGSSVPRCVSIDHAIGAWALAKIRRELSGRVTVVSGRVETLDFASARAIVLATGGWCGKYGFSTNPPELRGDGIALAQALGAATRDLDAVQYEPTVAIAPSALRGIPVITTMLYEGATIRNASGKEFLSSRHLNKDEMSKEIVEEIAAGRGVKCQGEDALATGNGVWYDMTGVPADVLRGKYGATYRRYASVGIDISRQPVLVAPAPHTSLGGVVIDTACRVLKPDGSAIPGLFAAGEVTGGLHGRNRLGGNAGTEVLVFGRIAGEEAARFVAGASSPRK